MTPRNIIIGVASTVGLGLLLTIIGMAGAWWISGEVAAQLKAKNIVPETTVEAVITRVENLEVIHGTDIVRVESKAERIAQILMEE